MSRNTALITSAAQTQAEADLDNYAAGVATHIGGDWGQHVQVQHHSLTYSCPAGAVSLDMFRFLLTNAAGTDVAVVCPAYPLQPVATGGVPIIALQPLSQKVNVGDPYQLRVYAASDIAIGYQWQVSSGGDYEDVPNAIARTYLVTGAVAPPAPATNWKYRCFVYNVRGGSYSDVATITVRS